MRILQALTSLVGVVLAVTLLVTYFGIGSSAMEGLQNWLFDAENTLRDWFSSFSFK